MRKTSNATKAWGHFNSLALSGVDDSCTFSASPSKPQTMNSVCKLCMEFIYFRTFLTKNRLRQLHTVRDTSKTSKLDIDGQASSQDFQSARPKFSHPIPPPDFYACKCSWSEKQNGGRQVVSLTIMYENKKEFSILINHEIGTTASTHS